MTLEELIMYRTEEACEEARVEAREKGLAEGREKGLAEGRAEGLMEGELKGMVKVLLDLNTSKEQIIGKIISKYDYTEEEITKCIEGIHVNA